VRTGGAPRPPVALTVAGTDPGGGAGVAADLKVFAAHGVWGTCAVTAVTVQDTTGVRGVSAVAPAVVAAQVDAVAGDIGVDAAKTGMLASAEVVAAVAAALARHGVAPVVVDPVLASGHGERLLAGGGALVALRDELVPLAAVVTPNLAEAAALVGFPVADRASMAAAGQALVALGAGAALVTGGHLGGPDSPDCLVVAGAAPYWLEGERLATSHTHGSGCVLSAALCAHLALGAPLPAAARAATAYARRAIAAGLPLGAGTGPVNPPPTP